MPMGGNEIKYMKTGCKLLLHIDRYENWSTYAQSYFYFLFICNGLHVKLIRKRIYVISKKRQHKCMLYLCEQAQIEIF